MTGGNVSFYNESPLGAVYPTPTIGMVGLLQDVDQATTAVFRTPGDSIILLGENTDELGASEYLRWIHGEVAGRPPACDLKAEAAAHRGAARSDGRRHGRLGARLQRRRPGGGAGRELRDG